jgi:hypothetical protein
MKKQLIFNLFGFLFIVNISFSQNVIFEVNSVRTLYFGYKNKLEFGTTDGRPFELIAENAKLELDSAQGNIKRANAYTVSPFGYQNVRVFMVDPISKKAFDTIAFNVKRIPDPEIYWGAARNGERGTVSEPRLFVKYPPEIPFYASWKMVSWECSIPGLSGSPISGTGNDISASLGKIKEAKMSQLNGARTETKISFICTIVGPDGTLRKRAAVFQL